MPILVQLKENRPGYADIEIKRWKGDADIEIAVQRNQDGHYFAEGLQWNNEPVWHRIADLVETEDALQGTLGPWLIDALVQQGVNTQYLLWVKNNDLTDRGVIRLIGNILASTAQGDSSREEDVRNVAENIIAPSENTVIEEPLIEEPQPVVEDTAVTQDVAEPVADTATPDISETAPKRAVSKSRVFPILLLLLVLIIGGIAAWFFLQNKGDETASSPANAACEMKAGDDELSFIQACLKTNPDTKQILSIIENAKKNNVCGVAQRLYANKAQGGNAEIAFAYAKEYDSAFSKGEGCFKLDKETAIYWYETGLANDPNNAEAKQRLEELKK